MTIKSSGTLSVSPDLISEWPEIGAPYDLTKYYGKGPGLPTKDRISLHDFYGVRRHPYLQRSLVAMRQDPRNDRQTHAYFGYNSATVYEKYGAIYWAPTDPWGQVITIVNWSDYNTNGVDINDQPGGWLTIAREGGLIQGIEKIEFTPVVFGTATPFTVHYSTARWDTFGTSNSWLRWTFPYNPFHKYGSQSWQNWTAIDWYMDIRWY